MHKLTVVLVLIALLLATPCIAFQNEPGGFRWLKWGSAPEKYPKMLRMIDEHPVNNRETTYSRGGETVPGGGEILYSYLDGRFYGVTIMCQNFSCISDLLKSLTSLHGPGKNSDAKETIARSWNGDTTMIDLYCDTKIGFGFAGIYSTKLSKEREAMERAEKQKLPWMRGTVK